MPHPHLHRRDRLQRFVEEILACIFSKQMLILIILWYALSFALDIVAMRLKFEAEFPTSRAELFKFYMNPNKFTDYNPTILDMSLRKYEPNSHIELEYTEMLLMVPFITTSLKSTYELYPSDEDDSDWQILSTHKSCFYIQSLCMTVSMYHLIKDLPKEGKSHLTEIASIRCPKIFRTFCAREMRLQRNIIYDNILEHFNQVREQGQKGEKEEEAWRNVTAVPEKVDDYLALDGLYAKLLEEKKQEEDERRAMEERRRRWLRIDRQN